MLVVFVSEFVEDLGVRVRQEFLIVEGIADRMVSYPFEFLLLVLVHSSLLLNEVSELVIRHYEPIEFLCVLNAIRVIVVLRRSLYYNTLISQLVKKPNIVRHLGSLEFFNVHL